MREYVDIPVLPPRALRANVLTFGDEMRHVQPIMPVPSVVLEVDPPSLGQVLVVYRHLVGGDSPNQQQREEDQGIRLLHLLEDSERHFIKETIFRLEYLRLCHYI